MQWVATRPLYCQGFLAAFGGTGIADNYRGCSEYANDLPAIVDEDGNYYDRFFVTNSLGIEIPIFRRYLSIPQLLRRRFEGQRHSLYHRYRQRCDLIQHPSKYKVVYNILSASPADLLTLVQKGSKKVNRIGYGNFNDSRQR
jgi:hypothetical protein